MEDPKQRLAVADNEEDKPETERGLDLSSLLGGVGSGQGQQTSQGGADLLGSLLGGMAGSQTQAAPQGGADLLGSLLGGLTGAGQPQTSAGANPLGMLGDLLGGGSGGGLLDSLLGGAVGNSNPLVSSLADTLSKRLGIDPAIAKAIVTFAMSKIVPVVIGKLTGQSAQAPAASAQPAQQQAPSGLAALLPSILGGRSVTTASLRATGLPQELAQQAGIEIGVAEKGLKQTFKLLGEQMTHDEGFAGIVQRLVQ